MSGTIFTGTRTLSRDPDRRLSGAVVSISGGSIDNTAIGAIVPAPGAFTTLSATDVVSGAGFTARFAAPGPIGSTTPSTGAFTNLTATGNVFGASSTALPAVKSSWTLSGSYSGAGTNGLHLHELLSNNSNYSVGTAGTFINTYVGSTLSGSTATGAHVALQAEIDQTGATPNLGQYVLGLVVQSTANANAGGALGTEHANVMGANIIAQVKAGATYFTSVVGAELDFVAKAQVLDKIGLSVVAWVGDAYAGSRSDAMAAFVRNPSGLIGMTNGIVFGAPWGWWPIAATGTIIGTPYDPAAGILAGAPAKAAAIGIDFSTVAFSTAFLKGPGFTVDGSGNTTALTFKVGANQVVGARQTGWSAPTGTLSRATFDQSSVTLPELAKRVAALVTDVTTHGLIGA